MSGSRSQAHPVAGRYAPTGSSDMHMAPTWTMQLVAENQTEARDLRLVVSFGGVFLIHVPAGCPLPGGYVLLGDLPESRRSTRGNRRYLELQCTMVDPPSPQITGTLLTWDTVHRLYGSWNAIHAAHDSWRSLLATVGDPDDLVVL